MNGVFTMQTLEEVIDHMYMLKADVTRTISSGVEAGLYIEIKDYEFYSTNRSLDMAQMLFTTLEKYNLSTIADCTANKLPIII